MSDQTTSDLRPHPSAAVDEDDGRPDDQGVVADPDAGGSTPLERLQADNDRLTDVLARTQAEFANYRKRIARDQAHYQDRAKATVLEAFIPALDALDAAAGHDDGLIGPLRKVVAETAERLGLERFEPDVGDSFDPVDHDALAAPPETGDDTDLVVSRVVRPGYRLGTRLLRAAEVAVDTSLPGPDVDGDPSEE